MKKTAIAFALLVTILASCAKARAQIHAGDDRTGPDETQHRKNVATGADGQRSAEHPGNVTDTGGG